MREVLDRLREAESVLDSQLAQLYLEEQKLPHAERRQIMDRYWKAKQALWYASMHVLYAGTTSTEP